MSELRKWLATAVAAFLLVLAVSFVAGQFRDWRKPKPPKPIPGHLDPGTPSSGPVNAARTVPDPGPIARPDLTAAELEAEAAKAGFKLVRKQTAPARGGGQGTPTPRPPATDTSSGEIVAPAPASEAAPAGEEQVFVQELFAKEHFGPGPAGDGLTIWAWQMREGGRIELMGAWDDYQPPASEVREAFFGNVAKWHWTVGGGGVASPDGVGPGLLLGMGWSGPRTGHVTWGVDLYGIGGQVGGKTTGAAFLGATARIE